MPIKKWDQVLPFAIGGRLIAGTGAQGTVIREHLYLDSLPVALVGRPERL